MNETVERTEKITRASLTTWEQRLRFLTKSRGGNTEEMNHHLCCIDEIRRLRGWEDDAEIPREHTG